MKLRLHKGENGPPDWSNVEARFCVLAFEGVAGMCRVKFSVSRAYYQDRTIKGKRRRNLQWELDLDIKVHSGFVVWKPEY